MPPSDRITRPAVPTRRTDFDVAALAAVSAEHSIMESHLHEFADFFTRLADSFERRFKGGGPMNQLVQFCSADSPSSVGAASSTDPDEGRVVDVTGKAWMNRLWVHAVMRDDNLWTIDGPFSSEVSQARAASCHINTSTGAKGCRFNRIAV